MAHSWKETVPKSVCPTLKSTKIAKATQFSSMRGKKWLRRDDGILSNTFLQRVSQWSDRRGRDGVASAAAYDMFGYKIRRANFDQMETIEALVFKDRLY